MAGGYQAIDETFILSGAGIIQRREIVAPLLERARTGNCRGDGFVGENPGKSKLGQIDILAGDVFFYLLGDDKRIFTPFRLHDAPVVASGAGVFTGAFSDFIFSGQNAPCNRTVWDDTDIVMAACGQNFNLRAAVEKIVVGLAAGGLGMP